MVLLFIIIIIIIIIITNNDSFARQIDTVDTSKLNQCKHVII